MLAGAVRLPTLESGRVRLAAIEPNDTRDLFTLFSDRAVMRYWSRPPMTDPREADDLIHEIEAGFVSRSLFQWKLSLRHDPSLIGTCTLSGIDDSNRRAEIGYALRSDHWHQGYMVEALTRLLRFSFDDLGLHRIEADVDPRNAASVRLLNRLGFREEGYLRERWRVAGEIQDSLILGLLSTEWIENEGKGGPRSKISELA